MTTPTVHGDATSPIIVEPDDLAWMQCKGFDRNTQKWIFDGSWTQTGGDAVTLAVQRTNETYPATLASFKAPRSTATKVYTFRLTVTAASGETGTGTCTVTVPPFQGV